MDILCDYHNFDVQWGNHDILWMGALPVFGKYRNVIRMCLRFGNMATLEDGYGINLLPLATFAMEAYGMILVRYSCRKQSSPIMQWMRRPPV